MTLGTIRQVVSLLQAARETAKSLAQESDELGDMGQSIQSNIDQSLCLLLGVTGDDLDYLLDK